MFIMIENPCSHSYVEKKISSAGIAWEASLKYKDAIPGQKFIGKPFLSGPPKYRSSPPALYCAYGLAVIKFTSSFCVRPT